MILYIKTLICASTLACAGFLSSPLEAKCRINIGINANLCPPVVRPCPPPIRLAPVPIVSPVCRGVIIRDPCPVFRPQYATVLASRPTNWDRYYSPASPCNVRRTEIIQQVDVYNCPPPQCEVSCLPTINSIYDCGELIQLSDGSLWHIRSFDKAFTKNWSLNDTIQVNRDNDPNHPFILVNTSSNSAVRAVMKCGASLQNGPTNSFSAQVGVIQNNIGEGDLIKLADGSLWEIASYENRKSKLWRPGETVQIGRSGNSVYPFILKNINANETVVALHKA